MNNESKKQKLHLGESYYKPIFFLDKEELFKHGDEMMKVSSESDAGERGKLGHQRLFEVAGELDKHKNSAIQHFRPEYVQGQKAYQALLKKAGTIGVVSFARLLGQDKQLEFVQAYSDASHEFNNGSNRLTLPTHSPHYMRLKEHVAEYMQALRKEEEKRAGLDAYYGPGAGESMLEEQASRSV